MTISPLSAVTSLATSIRPSAAEPAPASIAPVQGGNASQAPSGASQTETSSAVTAPAGVPPAEAVLPDPGPFVIAPSEPSSVTVPAALTGAGNPTVNGVGGANEKKSDNGGSSIVLKANEIPPSEDMQALIEARKRAEVLQDSVAMKQLIASLEIAVATELPTKKASNNDQPPAATREIADLADPNSTGSAPSMTVEKVDQSVDLRY